MTDSPAGSARTSGSAVSMSADSGSPAPMTTQRGAPLGSAPGRSDQRLVRLMAAGLVDHAVADHGPAPRRGDDRGDDEMRLAQDIAAGEPARIISGRAGPRRTSLAPEGDGRVDARGLARGRPAGDGGHGQEQQYNGGER